MGKEAIKRKMETALRENWSVYEKKETIIEREERGKNEMKIDGE